MDLFKVVNSKYQLKMRHGDEQGHWLLKDGYANALYSQSIILSGCDVVNQIKDMQNLIDCVSEAQKRLIDLLEGEPV